MTHRISATQPRGAGRSLASIAAALLLASAPLATHGQETAAPADLEPWFGSVTATTPTNWLFSAEHGWLSLYPFVANGFYYIYDPRIPGYLATNEALYPNLYAFPLNTWTYFLEQFEGPAATPRIFYNYAGEDYFFLPRLDPSSSIVEIAAGSDDFDTLVQLLTATDLDDVLVGSGPFTVFAPTDDAFDAIAGQLPDLSTQEGLDAATDILLYHVITGLPQPVFSAEIVSNFGTNAFVTMANSSGLRVAVDGGVVLNNTTDVVTPDIVATNGVIHVINEVLLPPPNIVEVATSDENFETLLTLVQAAGLDTSLEVDGPFTVFAPTDAAFDAIADQLPDITTPEGLAEATQILQYHVVNGANYSTDLVNGFVPTLAGIDLEVNVDNGVVLDGIVNVVTPDVLASNGVVHVIDQVLLPPPSITDIAAANPDFETLTSLLQATGLDATLDQAGTFFTVFAPTDDAFAAISGQLPDTSTQEGLDAAEDILLYHVVGVALRSEQVSTSMVQALNGDLLDIVVDDSTGEIAVNGISVTTTDIQAGNGIIHVINGVLLPPAN